MARKKYFQYGSLFARGKRNQVWVARWWEEMIDAAGNSRRIRRSEILGRVAEIPSRRQAERLLVKRMQRVNSDRGYAQSVRCFREFVRADWEPVILPTLKYAT